MIRYISFTIIFLFGTLALAQENIPIGTWRTHFSYYTIKHLAKAGDRIYASAENGLYFFDKDDNSITKISKIDGLQAEDISALYYDSKGEQLLIGYASGNLDVIKNNQIYNLDLTSTSQIIGSKRINHIVGFQRSAFIATDFGVLKFNLEKLEVTETYRELGEGFKPLQVNQMTTLNDSLFLATEEGVLASNLVENINLIDYQNWKKFTLADGIPENAIDVIAAMDNIIVAGIDEDQLYKYGGQWAPTNTFTGVDFEHAVSSEQRVAVTYGGNLSLISPALEVMPVQDNLLTEVNEAVIDIEGNLWIADASNGLVSNFQGGFQSYTPDGPYRNEVFRLSQEGNYIYAFPGGYTEGLVSVGNNSGFYVYEEDHWNNFNVSGVNNEIPEFGDIVDGAYHSGLNSFFLASVGYGLLQIAANGEKTIFNESNSPLQNLSGTERQVKVPAIAKGSGGLWVLNYGTNQPLHFLNKSGVWTPFSFSLTAAQYPLDVFVVENQVWMITNPDVSGGIFIYDPENERTRFLSNLGNNGGLAGDEVYDLAVDKDGLVWVGTNKGISVYTNPFAILEGNVDAIEPIFENRPLFSGEKVISIKIDGGNRKWIGTTKGVWLFNDAADEQILHFDKNNSPLPDNTILDIEINPNSGEVFFATPKGIVSYRGTATEADAKHADVRIFPNPITGDFKGTVGISGLASDAIIKITDTSGKLIWQTQASGGTATWNVSDYSGNRAASGIYLVFSASEDGEDTFVGKLAVIN